MFLSVSILVPLYAKRIVIWTLKDRWETFVLILMCYWDDLVNVQHLWNVIYLKLIVLTYIELPCGITLQLLLWKKRKMFMTTAFDDYFAYLNITVLPKCVYVWTLCLLASCSENTYSFRLSTLNSVIDTIYMSIFPWWHTCLIHHCLLYILFHLFLYYFRHHTVFILMKIILYFYMDHESEINNYTNTNMFWCLVPYITP